MLIFRGNQKKLFELCKSIDWTQASIVDHLQMSPRTFNRYWLGERELPERFFDQILKECLARGAKAVPIEDKLKLVEEKMG